jgi:large subunit ribosomal protein L35
MPKPIARRKTKKSVAKRFKLTSGGKLMRGRPGRRHLASSKTTRQRKRLRRPAQVHETMLPRLLDCLPFK